MCRRCLVRTDRAMASQFEQQVDVVIDEACFHVIGNLLLALVPKHQTTGLRP